SRGDLSINIKATRMNNYAFLIPRGKSGYFPIYEEVPRVHIRNSSEIARFPLSEAPLYWDIDVLSPVQRYYSYPTRTPLPYSLGSLGYSDYYQDYKANLLRTEYFTKGETGFKTTLYRGSYISYDPSVYIGATKRSAEFTGDSSTRSASDIALERQLKRESYQYLRNNHVISIGVPALLFKTTYRRIQSIKSEIPEKTLEQSSDRFSPQNSQDRQHEAEFSLSSNAFESMEFSIITIRDLRRFSQSYKPEPENRERWYYTIFRMGSYYDFLEGFGNQKVSHLERKRSFFSGIFFNNDYIYHTTLKKKLYNNLTLGYQLGGFRLPFIRRFKKLEAGGSWYHVFEAAYLDAYRVYLQTDLQITRFIGLEIELDSRVTQPWRYTNQVGGLSYYRNGQDPVAVTNSYSLSTDPAYSQSSFQRDLAYGSGVTGSNNRQTTALNINTFQFAFKHNLHNFDIRYGYSMNLRSIQGGLSMDKQVNFYDQSVFVTLSLTNIGFGDSSAFRDARARIYRFRKRPLDGGL
ncbi:MAG: LPS-assembly protein LptD, partial [Leptospiraceae bacterium]|nr:LPS-assembly protein LptD [Leptospiraceae bacterium]